MLWKKFGEMNSYAEINELAENLLNEGDLASLREMAAENGVADMAELYCEGEIPDLCDALSAAIGKIDVEAADYKPWGIMLDWIDYIKTQCMENELLAHCVRRKGKTLRGCIAALLKYSFENNKDIDKEMLKEAGVKNARVGLGIPEMGTAKKIITDYYLGKQAE